MQKRLIILAIVFFCLVGAALCVPLKRTFKLKLDDRITCRRWEGFSLASYEFRFYLSYFRKSKSKLCHVVFMRQGNDIKTLYLHENEAVSVNHWTLKARVIPLSRAINLSVSSPYYIKQEK